MTAATPRRTVLSLTVQIEGCCGPHVTNCVTFLFMNSVWSLFSSLALQVVVNPWHRYVLVMNKVISQIRGLFYAMYCV